MERALRPFLKNEENGMNTILVPTRFMEEERNTHLYAVHLARDLGYEVVLQYFIETASYQIPQTHLGYPPVEITQELIENSKKGAEKAFQQFKLDLSNTVKDMPKLSLRTDVGYAPIHIHAAAEDTGAGMLILTGKNRKEDKALFLTSLEDEMISQSEIPVWVIPPNARYKRPDKILYATDYQEEDVQTMKQLVDYTRIFDTALTVLHITDDRSFQEKVKQSGFLDQVRKKTGFDRIEFRVLIDVKDKDVASNINHMAESMDADIIVLLKENRGFFSKLFRKSTTRQLVMNTEKPILIFHQK